MLTQITPNLYIELDGLRFVRFAKSDTQGMLIYTEDSPVQQIDLYHDEVVAFKRFLENYAAAVHPRNKVRSLPSTTAGSDDALPSIPKPPKVEVSKYGEN